MATNPSFQFAEAEKEYHEASTDEQKLIALENMLKLMPSHKGAENLRANLRSRYKKLKEQARIKKKKSGKKSGIKKEDLQAVILGLTNSGKSSILKALTNADPKIASYGFTTKEPEIGTLNYKDCNIQIIDLPPIASSNFEHGIVHNADTIIIVVEKIDEIQKVLDSIKNKNSKKIIVFNKIDLYDENTKRKISDTLKTKKYNFVITSASTKQGIDELKDKIFHSFDIIRVYTRHPGKKEDNVPVIIPPNSTLKDVAEKILHGYSKKIKFAKVFGPSAKFSGQKIGLDHVVKDNDLVEFYTE